MSYLNWHYSVWPKLFILWRNSILFPYYYFSIPTHLRTLFAPWRRQLVKKRIGFHLDDILSVIILNLVSRMLGAIVRTATIFYGLLFMIVAFLTGIFLVAVWPLMLGISLPFYLGRGPQKGKEAQYYLSISNGDMNKLVHLLFKQPQGKFILQHLGLDMKKIIIGIATSPASWRGPRNDIPTMPQLFKTVSESYAPIKSLLAQNNLKSEDVYQTCLWYEKLHEKETPLLLDIDRIKSLPGIGHNWPYGYTVTLDKFSQDLTRKIPTFPKLFHREAEINALQRILLKTQGNNALIVGEPGVARHLLAEILAYRIMMGAAQAGLSHKRILSLNMHAVVSAKPNILEVKGLAEELLSEANYAGNIILCIDEIDKYLSEGGGRIDLSDVIVKFGESPTGIIGITTPVAYYKYIKPNSSLSPLFEKVDVEPLDKEKTVDVLELSITGVLETKYGLTITYPAIKKAVENADRYLSADPLPSKAIELLDEACVSIITPPHSPSYLRRGFTLKGHHEGTGGVKKDRVLTAPDIDAFLTEKMHMPLGELQKEESEKLANLENLLHLRIINQEEAIRVISSALRRARLSVANPHKPIGSFLFLGPTGVGKTETAKALSAIYFNSVEKLSRFDMSQYQNEEGLERLIGSIKLGSPGELTAKLADQPFSVLLLDEFEKADREIYNLFLTLLDEGYISDATGRKISAKNNIIIATSNAGSEFIRQKINQGIHAQDLQNELIEYVQTEKIFSPELLNRFDGVVVFSPLTEGQLREVAKLMLDDLNRRLAPKEISLDINQDLIRKIAALGFDPQFGARAMRRAISEKIEDQIAQKILRGEVQKGEQIHIQL